MFYLALLAIVVLFWASFAIWIELYFDWWPQGYTTNYSRRQKIMLKAAAMMIMLVLSLVCWWTISFWGKWAVN